MSDLQEAKRNQHLSKKLGSKYLDETGIANGYVIAFNSTTGNLEYAQRQTVLTNNYPTRAVMWHADANIITGNGLSSYWTTVVDTYGCWYQATSDNGDSFSNSCFLKAGTYTFWVAGTKRSTCGKIDWYLDGVKIVSLQDWYSSSSELSRKTTANITVTGDGYHQIIGTINGTNPSSGGDRYNMLLARYGFQPATDPARS